MAEVHPSAIVGPEVELAAGVEIGPWCRIDGRVRIGVGTRLLERVSLYGPLELGERNLIYPGSVLGGAPQDRKFDAATPGAGTAIGDDNVIREGVTVHRATEDRPTRLGDRNYLMVNVHVAHDGQIGNDCTLANNVLLAGHVTVQNHATFGGGASIHQFCRIGRLAMVSGLAGLSQDVPPFMLVHRTHVMAGINRVGLRRAGYGEHVEPLRRAFRLLYRSGMPNAKAAQAIRETLGDDALCAELAAFVAGAKRGIVPGPRRLRLEAV